MHESNVENKLLHLVLQLNTVKVRKISNYTDYPYGPKSFASFINYLSKYGIDFNIYVKILVKGKI